MDFEPTSSLYLYVRARQLEGTYSSDPETGCWLISAARIARGWGLASSAEWPYIKSPSEWPPAEPEGIDALAKPRRLLSYRRIRTARECSDAILCSIPVVATFEITADWFDAVDGEIVMPVSSNPIVGGHCVCIGGTDTSTQTLSFVNSWGKDWGKDGFGTMSFEYFDCFMTDAWIQLGLKEQPPIREYHPGIQYLNWGCHTFDGNILHVMEVFDFANDERIGWLFAIEREGWIEVEEWFVKPQFRSRGYGGKLLDMLYELKDGLRLSPRFLIPHGDLCSDTASVCERLLARRGAFLRPSDVAWAAAITSNQEPQAPTLTQSQPPQRPLHIWLPPNR